MIKPTSDNIVLEVNEAEKKTTSGIILTNNNNQPNYATVIAVGPGKIENGCIQIIDLKPGDKVVFKKYSATEIKLDAKDYIIVSYNDILAVIE